MTTKALQFAILLGLSCSFSSCTSDQPSSRSSRLFAQGSIPATGATYIVVLRNNAKQNPAKLAWNHGVAPGRVYRHALKGFSAHLPPGKVLSLASDPDVAFIQPDRMVYAYQQYLPEGVDRIDAELNPVANIDGVDDPFPVSIAIIDTGIDPNHEDLNVVGGRHFYHITTGPPEDRQKEDGDYTDDNGHGTHVAGTTAAVDNGYGVVGVAPGAPLYAVKVLDEDGQGYWSDVIAGIDWVTANATDIQVANMSLGGSGSDDGQCGTVVPDAMHVAICNSVAAGVTYVVAARNEMDDAANHVPASYDEVITVSALADFDGKRGGTTDATIEFTTCTENKDDSFACFSNYGHDVDLIAPGVDILSTLPPYLFGGYGYGRTSGTSMASPHVAGAAALIIAKNPGISPAEVREELIRVSDAAPCFTADGVCPDDGDATQEPLLYLGYAEDSFEDYSAGSPPSPPGFITQQSGMAAAVVSDATSTDGSQSLSLEITQDSMDYDYVEFSFCLYGPADDYLKASFSITWDQFASWDAIGATDGTDWVYWWWIRGNGTIFDDLTFDSFTPGTWHDVEFTLDRSADTANFFIDGRQHSILLSDGWSWIDPNSPWKCFFVLLHGQDAVHSMFIDNAVIRARP